MTDTGPPKANLSALADLSQRQIEGYRNFHQWLEAWQSAKHLPEMLSLLHECCDTHLFDALPIYNYDDMRAFLLDLANGWNNSKLLASGEDPCRQIGFKDWIAINKRDSEVRQMVAAKAFEVISLRFFKHHAVDKIRDEDIDGLASIIVPGRRAELFDAIKNFFRVETKKDPGRVTVSFDDVKDVIRMKNEEEPSYVTIPNLPLYHDGNSKHHLALAQGFIISLIEMIWIWDSNYRLKEWLGHAAVKRHSPEVMSLRPWTIEILYHLDQLHRLRQHIVKFDQASVEKLREIAMRAELDPSREPYYLKSGKTRKVNSVEEALMAFSGAARLYKEWEAVTMVLGHLKEAERIEEEIRDTRIKLAELEAKNIK